MSEIALRVRGPKEVITVSVSPSLLFRELKQRISASLGIQQDIELLAGFPPVAVRLQDEEPIQGHFSSKEPVRVQLCAWSGQQKQGSESAPRVPSSLAAPTANRGIQFGATIASLSNPTGRRAPVSRQSRARRVRSEDQAGSTDDIAEHLLAAVSGGSGTRNKTLRSVFRKAVELQYNATQAMDRLHSAYSGHYTFTNVEDAHPQGPTVLRQVRVTYDKGKGFRGRHTEAVDLLPKELLHTLLRLPLTDASLDKEVLKAINLAKASPRLFWSAVFHYGSDVEGGIQAAIQDLDDGSWLFERRRELSEKARENAQQAEELARQRAAKRRRTAAPAAPPAQPESTPGPLVSLVEGLKLSAVLAEAAAGPAQRFLSSDSLLALALAQSDAAAPGRNQFAYSIDAAQAHIHARVYHAVLLGSQKVKGLLARLRVRCLRELLVWRTAGAALLDGLRQLDPTLAALEADTGCALTAEVLERQLADAEAAGQRWPFLLTQEAADEVVEDCAAWEDELRVSSEPRGESGLWADSWQFDASHEWIGRRVRLFRRYVEEEEEEEEEEEGGEGRRDGKCPTGCEYWEDGAVVAYLPATEDEPMALWRVRLDAVGEQVEDVRVGRFEDLELAEVVAAEAHKAHSVRCLL